MWPFIICLLLICVHQAMALRVRVHLRVQPYSCTAVRVEWVGWGEDLVTFSGSDSYELVRPIMYLKILSSIMAS
jgi:hypothetical protein